MELSMYVTRQNWWSKALLSVKLDVKTAFLHGDLQEEIYMNQPPGYEAQSDLKLATGEFIYLLLYVDDMLIAASSQLEIYRMKRQFSKQFEMKELGEARKILGMEICRDKEAGKVWLTQRAYIEKVLKRFGIDDTTKAVTLPLAAHFQLSANLLDIAQAIGVVSRFMHDPDQGHWQAIKWILRYLKGTIDVGLVYERQQSSVGLCMGYTDSDYAGDIDRRRSTTGYLFTLAGGPVSWRSTLQSTVALSTTEAEYMAVTEAMKEAIWMQGLLDDLGVEHMTLTVFCDSQSAIFLTTNPVHHARTKHIDVRYHFVRDMIETGEVLLKKIDTKENHADMLTKVLSVQKFTYCKELMNVRAQR
ncbi:hypothetical protein KSP39_PZI003450 [Platanthera zijinensis]|uniref:Reverse transcriptase Ty1/copia-type domain-containing protein n=1 Tax=Platanthera zijinensis TaxID=2320716 RepID=A0AAP0GDI3_9ASPA